MDGVILIINFGREIEVSEKALPAHLAHGDSEDYSPLPEGLREFFEETLEVDIPNADDCFFFSIELDI